jgi:D-lactate dehydrogenase
MRIAIFEFEKWEQKAFDAFDKAHDVTLVDEALTKDNARDFKDIEIASTFIYSELSSDVIKLLPKLQMIATRSTGFDHIDIDYCNERGIVVSNVPTYGENTVAEHVFGLLLTISHHLVDAVDRTRKGDFTLKGLRGFDLKNKTLGVIGTGNIGRCVIEIAVGFGMNVLGYDHHPKDDLKKKKGFSYVDLDKLLGESDIVTLHVPGNKHTKDLLSTDEFGKMKDGIVLINTSRGSVVNISALVKAIADEKVRAAGLDVLPEEPLIREEAEMLRSIYKEKDDDLRSLLADHVLRSLRNVVITPHSAFYTNEAVDRIIDTSINNIKSYLKDEPQNVVAGGVPATA